MQYFPSTEKRGGRPTAYVVYNDQIIMGLSLKSDGRYYTTHNHPKTRKRIYFGRELPEAVQAFEKWLKKILGS